MERSALATIILDSPAWARIGLTVRDERMRERAADALAATIIERIERPDVASRDQLSLPL